jgi:hypothetical protein
MKSTMMKVNCKEKVLCMYEPEYHNEGGEGENKMAQSIFRYYPSSACLGLLRVVFHYQVASHIQSRSGRLQRHSCLDTAVR